MQPPEPNEVSPVAILNGHCKPDWLTFLAKGNEHFRFRSASALEPAIASFPVEICFMFLMLLEALDNASYLIAHQFRQPIFD